MRAKPIWHSKTFWVNLLMGLAALLSEVSNVLPDLLDPKWILFGLAVINLVLRLLTDQPVYVKNDPKPRVY